ncbi:MAG: hypothetical protein O2905_06035 [Proteobacteria bacterium]|nr:hypothetical protein [Pseudomonadota bacterium]
MRIPLVAVAVGLWIAFAAPAAGQSRPSPDCRSDPAPMFSAPFTDLDAIKQILPPAVISGERFKNRSYVWIRTDADGDAPEVPVFAPTDAVVTGITYFLQPMNRRDGSVAMVDQYILRLEVSCEVQIRFDHMDRLSPPLAAVAPAVPVEDTRNAEVQVRVPVAAGDLLAHTAGTIVAHNWDIIVANSTVTREFANRQRYAVAGDLQWLLRTDCAFDYAPPALRAQYYALLVDVAADADGCFVMPDTPGAVAGGWFRAPFDPADQFGDPGWALAIATTNGQVRVQGPGWHVWVSPDAATWTDPRTVTGEHCYAGQGGYAWLRISADGDRMEVAHGGGGCPRSMPGGAVTVFR